MPLWALLAKHTGVQLLSPLESKQVILARLAVRERQRGSGPSPNLPGFYVPRLLHAAHKEPCCVAALLNKTSIVPSRETCLFEDWLCSIHQKHPALRENPTLLETAHFGLELLNLCVCFGVCVCVFFLPSTRKPVCRILS